MRHSYSTMLWRWDSSRPGRVLFITLKHKETRVRRPSFKQQFLGRNCRHFWRSIQDEFVSHRNEGCTFKTWTFFLITSNLYTEPTKYLETYWKSFAVIGRHECRDPGLVPALWKWFRTTRMPSNPHYPSLRAHKETQYWVSMTGHLSYLLKSFSC